jgi:hypothetical protein
MFIGNDVVYFVSRCVLVIPGFGHIVYGIAYYGLAQSRAVRIYGDDSDLLYPYDDQYVMDLRLAAR